MDQHEFSSGGIIIKKGGNGIHILLVKDSYGRWTWPKGHVEKGETPIEAATREIGEEVGLKELRLIDEIARISYFYRREGKLIYKTVLLFLFEATGSQEIKVQLTELKDARWLDPKDALKKVEYKGAKGILKKAIEKFRIAS